MRINFIIVLVLSLFLTQLSFAMDDSSDKQCDVIASACKNAGFNDNDTSDKSFWFSCMKPILLGKTVSGVTVDAKDIKNCRIAKIAKMKKELKEFQAVK